MNIKDYCCDGTKTFFPQRFDTSDTADFASKEEASARLISNIDRMAELQDRLYAENKEAVLIIFQAMDAAGKDGAIKHVMSGMNPQGITVHNFKQPTSEELDHDYLWRAMRALPNRGNIGIFNRSYYEDVLIVKVHELYKNLPLPKRCMTEDFFERRYRQIADFERYLDENGIRVIKFFLHISKDEQKQRFLARIDDPNKNWKFSQSDIEERTYWDDYQEAYADAINATSTEAAPWYIIPSDKKWFARLLISEIIVKTLEDIDPQYPELAKDKAKLLGDCRERLLKEK